MRYIVSLYDKDNDYFKDMLKTDNLAEAKALKRALDLIFSKHDIILRRNDIEFGMVNNEPFDECQIWDTEYMQIVKE